MDRMKTILITGGNGYLGKALYGNLKNKYNVTLVTRDNFDITDFISMNSFFEGKYFDVVLHCAVKGGSRLEKDSYREMDINLTMYYNLLQHKESFGKLISFGSGAEIYAENTPYGLSKNIISKSLSEIDDFFNIRIFAVFNEDEWDTRFIKANLIRYIKKEPIIIHENRLMDFFYMKDLFTLVKYYIETSSTELPKLSECTYNQKYTLFDVADIINNLSNYKVPIKINSNSFGNPYIGKVAPSLDFIGLNEGIILTYNHLLRKNIINGLDL